MVQIKDTVPAASEAVNARWAARSRWAVVLLLPALAFSVLLATRGGEAATGDNLRPLTAAVSTCATSTGIAFDGSVLYLGCWGSTDLRRVSPADGSSLGPLTISGIPDIAALSWDPVRHKIWACSFQGIYLIDTSTQTATLQFSVAGKPTVDQCWDGLAYDASDDTVWVTFDGATLIDHYSPSGVLLGSLPLSNALFGGFHSSGFVATASHFYVANQDGGQIFSCAKDLSSCTLLASFAHKIEDLECDATTFAPKVAVWSQDAFDLALNAWEVPDATCGAALPPTATATGTRTAPPAIVRSATPTPTATVPPRRTPSPGASTPVPSNTSAPPASSATSPAGGIAGHGISGPDTGTGPGSSGLAWPPLLALLIGGAAVGSLGWGLSKRR